MKTVDIRVNAQTVSVPAGASVAAAIATAAATCFRRSVTGRPRAAMCGMGVCHECRVRINGVAHVRACMTVACEGMRVQTDD